MSSPAFERFMKVVSQPGATPAGSMMDLVLRNGMPETEQDCGELLTAALSATGGNSVLRQELHELAEQIDRNQVDRPRG